MPIPFLYRGRVFSCRPEVLGVLARSFVRLAAFADLP
jgi:hypothetical protein